MSRYRIEVGQSHGVHPKHIVGSIANEVDLDSEYIGPIRIHDDHSLVDLPEGMPKPVYKHLKKVWVCGRKLNLSLVDAGPGGGDFDDSDDSDDHDEPEKKPKKPKKPKKSKAAAKKPKKPKK